MSKKIIFLAFFLFPSIAFSQYDFGLKAGINGVDLIDESSFENGPDYQPKLAFNAGVYMKFNFFEKLDVLAELIYSNKGARYPAGIDGSSGKLNLNYLNISYLALYNIKKDFELLAGLEFGYLINTVSKFENITVTDYSAYNNFDLGLAAGVRYHLFENASLDLRYIIGLIRPINDEIFITDDGSNGQIEQLKYRNHLLQLNFSYTLVRK